MKLSHGRNFQTTTDKHAGLKSYKTENEIASHRSSLRFKETKESFRRERWKNCLLFKVF
jgi:hypothetical protein